MEFISDLHIHSKYSRAVSPQMTLAFMAEWAAKKGMNLITTGDFTHPLWFRNIKGELEEATEKLTFKSIRILQPGILDGERSESRPLEKLAISVSRGLIYLPGLKKYRPIHAETVAKAMINACFDKSAGVRKYTLEEVFKLAAG